MTAKRNRNGEYRQAIATEMALLTPEKLRAYIAARQIAQKDVAAAIGASQSTVSRIFAGRQALSTDHYLSLVSHYPDILLPL